MAKQPYENFSQSRKELLWNNFLSGIAWGLGTTIGLAIVISIIGFLATKLDWVPFFGNFATEIAHYVQSH